MAGDHAQLPKDAPGNEILARVWQWVSMKRSLVNGSVSAVSAVHKYEATASMARPLAPQRARIV